VRALDDPEHVREQHAIDQSERMVQVTRARGADARGGDVRALPFEDGTLDAVVAAWMLFHVSDLAALASRFSHVERRDAHGTVTIRDAETIRSYLRSSERLARYADETPELDEPLVATRHNVVFVAEKR
jgi:hypothetical protein